MKYLHFYGHYYLILFQVSLKELLIGHYSKRYKDLNVLLDETKQYFNNSFLTKEGDVFDFNTF
mgnify:CR=1 FL=1